MINVFCAILITAPFDDDLKALCMKMRKEVLVTLTSAYIQFENLTEELILKTNREKQLAEKLEDLRYTHALYFVYFQIDTMQQEAKWQRKSRGEQTQANNQKIADKQ